MNIQNLVLDDDKFGGLLAETRDLNVDYGILLQADRAIFFGTVHLNTRPVVQQVREVLGEKW